MNLTWLAALTSVATVGIIGGVKIIPQWILNGLFQLEAGACDAYQPAAIGLRIFLGHAMTCNGSFDQKTCQFTCLDLSIKGDSTVAIFLWPLKANRLQTGNLFTKFLLR